MLQQSLQILLILLLTLCRLDCASNDPSKTNLAHDQVAWQLDYEGLKKRYATLAEKQSFFSYFNAPNSKNLKENLCDFQQGFKEFYDECALIVEQAAKAEEKQKAAAKFQAAIAAQSKAPAYSGSCEVCSKPQNDCVIL
jgi:hypothetical protein